MPARADTLVVVATYNERENIRRLIGRVLGAAPVDLLVIDDASPDGTGELLEVIAAVEPRVTVHHRPAKMGVASAHVFGFQFAEDRGYDLMVEMDADFSHPPEDVPRLITGCAGADVAIGSRSVRGGRIMGRSWFRDALTRFGAGYARVILGLPVRDCTGGFRCTRRAAWHAIAWTDIRSHGYGFQLELNYAWTKAGIRFAEVPIVFRDRSAGASKMTMRILVEALLVVVRLRLGIIPVAVKRPGDGVEAA